MNSSPKPNRKKRRQCQQKAAARLSVQQAFFMCTSLSCAVYIIAENGGEKGELFEGRKGLLTSCKNEHDGDQSSKCVTDLNEELFIEVGA